MSKIIFAKYNKNRRKKFQISTVLYEDSGKRYAKKTALTDEAFCHISNMQLSYNKLKDVYSNITLLEGDYTDRSVTFEYIEGKNVTDKLLDAVSQKSKEQFLEYLKNLAAYIFETKCQLVPFEKSDEFIEVFGDVIISDECMPVTNVDMIYDNIVERKGQLICLDYEWVFEFKIPIRYVQYRSLHYFYTRNASRFGNDISEKEIMDACGIDDSARKIFKTMENNFQKWVFGEEDYALHYMKGAEKNVVQNHKQLVARILQLQEEVEERNQHIAYLNKEIEKMDKEMTDALIEKDRQIMELSAMNVTKDQHIANFRRGYDKWMKLTSPYHFTKRKAKGALRRARTLKKHLERKRIVFPYFEQPKVSIVIPVYNQFEYTWDCLKSIYDNTEDISYEIIIGDDGSTDRTTCLERYAKGIKIIRNSENLRFLRNCNNAAKVARGDYVLFLNNDTQVRPDWLSSLVELIESDEKIGMVGSKLVYPDGSLQEAGGIIWKDASGWNYGRNDDASKPEYNYVREVDYISGAAIMIRHRLWKEIGGFDELYAPAYCEDSDLAFEVRKHGYKVMYQPESVVVHFEGISNGTDLSAGVKKYQVENNQKFREKWKSELAQHYENSEVLFCARERNFNKKVILIVDHYVPTFDKDAGSKTTFQYIKMFLKKGYIVKFIGDNFAQMEPYTSILQQMGVEVLYGAWYTEHIFDWIEENQEHIHVAYLNRPHITEKYIHFFARKTNIRIVYYGHDLGYLREEREAQVTGNQEIHKTAEKSRKKEFSILREAGMSYYPSQVEVDAVHEIDPKIPVKAITAYVFDEFQKDFCFDPEKREGILFVGGFSHGPNIDAVKWFINDIYPMIRKKEEIPFYIVGSNAPEEFKKLEGNGVVFKGFVSEEELGNLYHTARIVVVPLRFGAGVKGKVVEALYYGTPLVTTSVGAEGICGIEDVSIIKDSAKELAEEILKLYHNNDRMKEMARMSQDYVKDHFSIDAAWKVIENDFA